MTKPNSKNLITVSFPQGSDIVERLDAIAEREQRSRSNLVYRVLLEFVREDNKRQSKGG